MKYSIDSSTLTDIANAIRTQYGESDKIAVSDFAEAIENIPSGEGSDFDVQEIEFISEINIANNPQRIPHSLGVTPNVVLLMGTERETAIPDTDYVVANEINVGENNSCFTSATRTGTRATSRAQILGGGSLRVVDTIGDENEVILYAVNLTYQSRLLGKYKLIVGKC